MGHNVRGILIIIWASLMTQQVKTLPANAGDAGDLGSIPRSRRSPGGGNGNPTAVFLPEKKKKHEQRSLVGYSLKGCTESDVTEEQLSTIIR